MAYRSSPAHVHPAKRTRHRAVCDDCGTSTTVPFRPVHGKPVYCPSCLNTRRHGHASMVRRNGTKPSVVSNRAVDSAPSGGPVFSGMPLKAATRAAISPDEHIEAHTHSGEGYTSSHGRTRLDWPGACGIRQGRWPSRCPWLSGAIRRSGRFRRLCCYPHVNWPSRWPESSKPWLLHGRSAWRYCMVADL